MKYRFQLLRILKFSLCMAIGLQFMGCPKKKGRENETEKKSARQKSPTESSTESSTETPSARDKPKTKGDGENQGKRVLSAGVTKELISKWLTSTKKEPGDTPANDTQKKDSLITGYRISYGPKFYHPKNFYDLLNGGADMYVEAGTLELVHFRLKHKDDNYGECRASMFFMKTPEKAIKLLQKEKADSMKKMEVGDEAWGDEEGILFSKGKVFVQIESLVKDKKEKHCPFVQIAANMTGSNEVGW